MTITMATTTRELRTSDLALASYLRGLGHTHDRMELLDKRAAVWVFLGDGELHAAADHYQDGQAEVEPKAFMMNVREVRDELYKFLKANR